MLVKQVNYSHLKLLRGFVAAQQQTLFLSSAMTVSGSKRLEGKVAIVTASTDGIGLGIAKRLAEDGCSVMLNGRKTDKLTKALESLKGLSVSGVAANVAKEAERDHLLAETIKQFGGIDFLVSNAGINLATGPENTINTTEEMWDKTMDLNLKASFFLAKAVVPEMLKRGTQGSIVFISSVTGLSPAPALSGGAYTVSKSGMVSLTRCLSEELGPKNIRVNSICPGIILTKMTIPTLENPKVNKMWLNNINLRRFGTPADVGAMASFLCSEDASFVTGENIQLTGGFLGRM